MSDLFDVFISYGRADSKYFAAKLTQKLNEQGLNVWFDKDDIPLAVDYQAQINRGIEQAHNFVFIISPHSVNSQYCLKEIELALKLNKHIIPILHVEQIDYDIWQSRQKLNRDWSEYQAKGLHSSFQNMHPEISKINWIYCREDLDDFAVSFEGLIQTIERNKSYLEKQTRFLVKALDWSRNQKQTSYLLIGASRREAEAWLKYKFSDRLPPCLPTDLHCEFISESIKNANNLMTQVFLSAAEENQAVKDKIGRSLMREALTIWTNQTDIRTGTAFQAEINKGIKGADIFVYLISLDTLRSQYCQQELKYALAHNKYIIPLLIEEIDFKLIPTQLLKLQFIDLTGTEAKYNDGIDKLLKALKNDAFYYEMHKLLLVKALKWQGQNYNSSILLRGYNLQHFADWLIASASEDGTIKLWQFDGTLLHTLRGHWGSVRDVAFSPDGERLVSGSHDNTIKLWQTDGTLLLTLEGHRDKVIAVDFSPDGRSVVSGSEDNSVRLWQLDNNLLTTLFGHQNLVREVAFSPNGQLIASASADRTVKLWDNNGKLLNTLRHSDRVLGVAFSPDGQLIASASVDKTVKLWRWSGDWAKLERTLIGHSNAVESIDFNPDGLSSDGGKILASGSEDRTVILWNKDNILSSNDLLVHGCAWVKDYLNHNQALDKSDRTICDGIYSHSN